MKTSSNSNYKIDKHIPLPSNYLQSVKWVSLAKKMNVGDSVLFDTQAEAVSLGNAIKRQGFKAVIRDLRVWKIEE